MRHLRLTFVPIGLALLLGACGGSDGEESTPGTVDADGVLTVEALDRLAFDHDSFVIPAGGVDVEYVNRGAILHTLVVEGIDSFRLEVSGSEDSDSGTLDLEPGTYELFCDVSGHRQGGMSATLTVE